MSLLSFAPGTKIKDMIIRDRNKNYPVIEIHTENKVILVCEISSAFPVNTAGHLLCGYLREIEPSYVDFGSPSLKQLIKNSFMSTVNRYLEGYLGRNPDTRNDIRMIVFDALIEASRDEVSGKIRQYTIGYGNRKYRVTDLEKFIDHILFPEKEEIKEVDYE